MSEEILRVENITKSYDDRVVLKNVNLDIKSGEILGVIGSSGSGKTTFLNMLIGFLDSDSGDIKFRQKNLIAGSEENSEVFTSVYKKQRYFKTMYGFASQMPSFYEKLTVKENLVYFGELYGLSKESLNANIKTLLDLLNLSKYSDMLGKNLSGGMERRLDIACALIHNPEILILDEPTADLDPVLRRNIWELIRKINRRGTTVILSSHHLNELETLCDRIAIIKDSTILDIGSADELKKKLYKSHEVVVESYPGKYDELRSALNKKFGKKVKIKISDSHLSLSTTKPESIINDVISIFEKNEEKILDLRLGKPGLDQLFISLQEK
ncbi:MAG: ABC transporter ATP-binding protein [Candidatus Woesearchaeota archaeon]